MEGRSTKKREGFWKSPRTDKRGKTEGRGGLVYFRERERRAVSNLAHLLHRWRLKRKRGSTFLFTLLFLSGEFTTRPDMGATDGAFLLVT